MGDCRVRSSSQMLSGPAGIAYSAYSITSSVLPLKHRMRRCATLPHTATGCNTSAAKLARMIESISFFEAILSAAAASGSLKQQHQPIPSSGHVLLQPFIHHYLYYLSICLSILVKKKHRCYCFAPISNSLSVFTCQHALQARLAPVNRVSCKSPGVRFCIGKPAPCPQNLG